MIVSEKALEIARQHVWTSKDKTTGMVTVGVCNGSSLAWAVGHPAGPGQESLVAQYVDHEIDLIARFIQMGLDAREG